MWYYFKLGIFLFVYSLLLAVTGLGIMLIEITWLAFTLSLVNIALFIGICVIYMKQQGVLSVKKMHANDLEREEFLRTGEYREIDKHREYKPWKGYAIGAITIIPLVVCLLIHLITGLAVGFGVNDGAGTASNIMYLTFFAPVYVLLGKSITGVSCFILAYCAPVIIVTSGVSYWFGARKMLKQYAKIQQTQESIYGKKS